MKILETIKNRRSIRSFDPSKEVSRKEISILLEAAIWAPSGGNTQPWRFFVVSSKKVKTALFEASYRQEYIIEAPYSIVVCIDMVKARSKYQDRGLDLYSIQDTAAAIQNILLTATDLGLGTCWIGAFDESKASKALDLGKELRPVAILPIGHANEAPMPPHREAVEKVTVWVD